MERLQTTTMCCVASHSAADHRVGPPSQYLSSLRRPAHPAGRFALWPWRSPRRSATRATGRGVADPHVDVVVVEGDRLHDAHRALQFEVQADEEVLRAGLDEAV